MNGKLLQCVSRKCKTWNEENTKHKENKYSLNMQLKKKL